MVRPKKTPTSSSMVRSRTAVILSESSAGVTDTVTEAEPKRKRRIASLNAEFLVHYTSKSNSQQQRLPTEALAKSKRKRSVSDNSISTVKKRGRRKLGDDSIENSSSATPSIITKKTKKRTTEKQAVKQEDTDDEQIENTLADEEFQALQIENYAKIINDFALKENEIDDELEEEYETPKKPVLNKKNIKKSKRQLKSSKEEDADGDEQASSSQNTSEDKPNQEPTKVANTGRPKREASIRASAMIIQTNEIEKTKYQYHFHHSNSNPATPTTTAEPLSLSNTEQQRLKHSHSFSSFQVPQFSSTVYASLTAAAAQASKPLNTASKKQQRNPKPLRHISTTTTLGAISGTPAGFSSCHDDDDSNDVLIIESPIRSKTALAGKVKDADKVYPLLTEDVMKEHNRIDEANSNSSGSGAFSSFTRDYIIKWTSQYKMTDEMPFAPGQIPIESFGVKILNEPQYLAVKSRQENGNTSSNVLKPSLSRPNSSSQLTTTLPPNKRLAEAIAVKSKPLNDCEPVTKDLKCLNNNTSSNTGDIVINKAMPSNQTLSTLKTAIQLTIQQQNEQQKARQQQQQLKYVKPKTNGPQSMIPEYISAVPVVNSNQKSYFPTFELTTNLLNQTISPNASPFANMVIKKEPKFNTSSSSNIPIINVENLNVYSSPVEEKPIMPMDTNNYHHHHHHYHHDPFTYIPNKCQQEDHNYHQQQTSAASSTQAAAVAAAAVAFNLAKFLNQNNDFKPSFFQNNQKNAKVKIESLKIEVPKQEAISLSSSSSLSIKTIEIGDESEEKISIMNTRILPTVKEEKYNIEMESCSSTVNLIVDETLETVETSNLITQSGDLFNEASNTGSSDQKDFKRKIFDNNQSSNDEILHFGTTIVKCEKTKIENYANGSLHKVNLNETFNSLKVKNKKVINEQQSSSNCLNELKKKVLTDLLNENSNTNYSLDDDS